MVPQNANIFECDTSLVNQIKLICPFTVTSSLFCNKIAKKYRI